MGTRQKEPLRCLAETELAALRRIAQASSERVDRVRRARALLAVAAGGSLAHAAREAGVRSGTTVAHLVTRFNRHGLAALTIASGRGRKPSYDTEARATIVALAQHDPERRKDGTATWSLSTLQKRLRKDGLERIGTNTIKRVLEDAGSSYQKTRSWCPTGTARAGAQDRRGDGGRSGDGAKKGVIELAYRIAEEAGIGLWCQDEAGPYQTKPYPGESWEPWGEPARQPHEYVRNGTAKLLTLFRPATGTVRAKGVTSAPNAILHPWLTEELSAILAGLPAVTLPDEDRPEAARWKTWLGHAPRTPLPPLRVILIWDNLAGHLSWSIVHWLFGHGVMPLYTPLSGSWLNLAEALQRIIVRRALSGQHPQTAEEIITWLEDTVAAWNEDPTPFTWGGKRKERRDRARQRRLGGSPGVLPDHSSKAA
jgi:transposase